MYFDDEEITTTPNDGIGDDDLVEEEDDDMDLDEDEMDEDENEEEEV